jgi:pyruvate/2-oxoacid:ferredoxin oxidoreductase beta subunit
MKYAIRPLSDNCHVLEVGDGVAAAIAMQGQSVSAEEDREVVAIVVDNPLVASPSRILC